MIDTQAGYVVRKQPTTEDKMAELLDDDELRDALDELDDWHGDRSEIRRTVTVRGSDQPALLQELERVAR